MPGVFQTTVKKAERPHCLLLLKRHTLTRHDGYNPVHDNKPPERPIIFKFSCAGTCQKRVLIKGNKNCRTLKEKKHVHEFKFNIYCLPRY